MSSKRDSNSLLSNPPKYRRIIPRTTVPTISITTTPAVSFNDVPFIRVPVMTSNVSPPSTASSSTLTTTIRKVPEVIDLCSDEEDTPLDLDIDWGLSFDQNAEDDDATALFESLISQMPDDSIDSLGKSFFHLNIFLFSRNLL